MKMLREFWKYMIESKSVMVNSGQCINYDVNKNYSFFALLSQVLGNKLIVVPTSKEWIHKWNSNMQFSLAKNLYANILILLSHNVPIIKSPFLARVSATLIWLWSVIKPRFSLHQPIVGWGSILYCGKDLTRLNIT